MITGDVLMEIVPDNDVLVVAAKVPPLISITYKLACLRKCGFPRSRPARLQSPSAKFFRSQPMRFATKPRISPITKSKFQCKWTQFPEKVREKLKPDRVADVLISTGERTVLAYLT